MRTRCLFLWSLSWLLAACSSDRPAPEPPQVDAGLICTADDECEHSVTVGPPDHMPGTIVYADRPPAGGPHNDCWGEWGVHDMPLEPEHWVHNLEHGGVVYLYRCPDGCAGDVAALTTFVDKRPRTVLTEYDDMGARFAAIAWGVRLLTQELDLKAFAAFYDAHAGHGLEPVTSGPPAFCEDAGLSQ